MKRSRKNLIITLAVTFVLMSLLVVFTSRVIFRTAFNSVQELGEEKAAAITAELENYLNTAKSVLWLAADTVDYMVENGASNEEIVEYITRESSRTEERFDESYTGIYGVIRGEYVDGVNWTPPEDYDPTKREWYILTVSAGGDVTLIPPYVDAQTGNVIISVGMALSDNNNAMAMDLTLAGVQEMVERIAINGYGYGFIVNDEGMVIAHRDRNEKGRYYNEDPVYRELLEQTKSIGTGSFDTELSGDDCTIFVDKILDQWHLVIVTRNSELYSAPMSLLAVSIIISLIVFILISIFYIVGYLSERKSNLRIERMKEIERKKDYEARILKLEKSAADSANKAKSNFLADMSHEIRTPINAILGMNEMILHESTEDATVEYASNIKSAGNTLLSIINSILDFSKIEDGRMHLVPAEFDTNVLISGLINSISERAKSKHLDFIVEVDENIPSKLVGDDVRISQVIMNLLTNAVKYTEKGEIKFTIKHLGTEDKLERLFVSVKDTGTGIRKEDIDKLSISFERLEEKKNHHIEGTGLGISIVTRLLAMMNSELKIESEYGKGSDFFFELKLEIADPKPIGKDDRSRISVETAGEDIKLYAPKAGVLLTDDNDMNCKVGANLLRLYGITPVVCKSGEDTIEAMRKDKYDILLLDHMMPGMDGIETLEALKKASLIGNTKVIALTANAVVGAKERYLEAGFDDYLSKPVELPALEGILRKYLPVEYIEIKPEEADTAKADHVPVVRYAENEYGVMEFNAMNSSDDDEIMEFAPQFSMNDFMGYENDISVWKGSETGESRNEMYYSRLRELGIDVEKGLGYCAKDEAFYAEVINDYIEAAPERIGKLEGFLKEGKIRDYEIVVHAAKSASKTIGAMKLYEETRKLEQAANDKNTVYLNEHHEEVMEELRELADRLKGLSEENRMTS